MALSQQQPPQAQIQTQLQYVDRPEISETFVDSLRGVMFDGMNLRLEFVVNRMDEPRPSTPPSGKSYPVCRIVIPLPSGMAMVGQINGLIANLQAQGLLRPIHPPQGTPQRPN
jgi:hypothetical protein